MMWMAVKEESSGEAGIFQIDKVSVQAAQNSGSKESPDVNQQTCRKMNVRKVIVAKGTAGIGLTGNHNCFIRRAGTKSAAARQGTR
ncbi:hypothetical protein NGC37_05085 [Pantoea anthophila]|uniref:hypothetical protein n=1 Tax=Pantoea anthophila TaxID=470931 RepID=UPI002DBAC413|nr:hypothetical protein [Pantoea anthophila]MEB7537685.1 hypothetical protein [Pantoea anthophila]